MHPRPPLLQITYRKVQVSQVRALAWSLLPPCRLDAGVSGLQHSFDEAAEQGRLQAVEALEQQDRAAAHHLLQRLRHGRQRAPPGPARQRHLFGDQTTTACSR